jgi:hypothetical protein
LSFIELATKTAADLEAARQSFTSSELTDAVVAHARWHSEQVLARVANSIEQQGFDADATSTISLKRWPITLASHLQAVSKTPTPMCLSQGKLRGLVHD